MWKVIKDLYTNVKAQVLYAVSLSRKIDVSPFMYKVYVSGLLCVLTRGGTLNVEVIGMLVGNSFGEP